MGKTNASASRVINFTKKLGNFNTFITCDKGDVYITVRDMTVNDQPSNYVPDFTVEANRRTLEFNIYNTNGNGFVVRSCVWKMNGVPVNTLSAYFTHGITNKVPWLEIKGAIATLSNNQPITITAECSVSNSEDDPDTVVVRGAYHIPVAQYQEGAYRVMIASCNDEANYTIVDRNTTLELQCLVYDWEGIQVTQGLTYKWYKLGYSGAAPIWEEKWTNTQSIDVPESDVDNQAMVKVEAYLDGVKIGEDTQMIYDNQDPFELDVTPSVATETIVEGGDVQQIDYKVNIISRNLNVQPQRAKITFHLYDSVQNPLQDGGFHNRNWENLQWTRNPQNNEYGPNTVMFTVYADDFTNGGTSLTLDITAEIE